MDDAAARVRAIRAPGTELAVRLELFKSAVGRRPWEITAMAGAAATPLEILGLVAAVSSRDAGEAFHNARVRFGADERQTIITALNSEHQHIEPDGLPTHWLVEVIRGTYLPG